MVELTNLLACRLPLGFAPRIAKLTFALRPSIMGFGSLHALSAAGLSPMITCVQIRSIIYSFNPSSASSRSSSLPLSLSPSARSRDRARTKEQCTFQFYTDKIYELTQREFFFFFSFRENSIIPWSGNGYYHLDIYISKMNFVSVVNNG